MRFNLTAGLVMAALIGAATMSVPAAARATTQVGRVLQGEQLFKGYCASCHGRTGKGDGPFVQALKTPPADLSLLAQRNGGTFPRERVILLIQQGKPAEEAHGSKEMPVWGPIFAAMSHDSFKATNPRIEDVVSYLESIQGK
jgi:mono/diheme cytochrome c family protein